METKTKCELISIFMICIFHFKKKHFEKKLLCTNSPLDKFHASLTIP